MKRGLNDKGVTLIELIVSFALVAVAIIYFYQTLYTVRKLYGESQKETSNFVDVDYAYRIIDKLHNQYVHYPCDKLYYEIEKYKRKDHNFLVENVRCNNRVNRHFSGISFKINKKTYNMYFYN